VREEEGKEKTGELRNGMSDHNGSGNGIIFYGSVW